MKLKMRLENGVYQILARFDNKNYWCSVMGDDKNYLYILHPINGERLNLNKEQREYFEKYKQNIKYSYDLLGMYMDFT